VRLISCIRSKHLGIMSHLINMMFGIY